MERPAKRTKLLSDSENSDSETDVKIKQPANRDESALKINKEYARRFEHNKQREERQQLEEKLRDEDDESSTDESEDDDADLITDDLDNEIMSTLQAIRTKDPRVYNKDIKFYRDFEQSTETTPKGAKKDAPLTLKEYHRQNILAGYTGEEEDDEADGAEQMQTYDQEQDSLRRDVISQMHAAGEADSESDDGLQLKSNGVHERMAPTKTRQITTEDVANADKDPDTFLSNFMAAQAWRTGDVARPHAFDSDDSDDDDRADAFEDAYNMRFEDPAKANETLKSFARDAGQYSVRRDEAGGRKKQRERERQRKEEAKQERQEERARLRKLKIDEAEKKLKVIKKAAGMHGRDVDVNDWRDLLDGDFSDEAWDKEMASRFGTEYYAEKDTAEDASNKSKPSKPVWDDDIDITDIVTDFDDNEGADIVLSDGDDEAQIGAESTIQGKKDRGKDKRKAKAQHRREQREIADLVDASLPVAATQAGGFRYRETSPNAFGLDHRDILFASDKQLNQFVGLKKLATFRDEARKSVDRKKLSKKARLRQWRQDVFGNPDGAVARALDAPGSKADQPEGAAQGKKRKRSRKSKAEKAL